MEAFCWAAHNAINQIKRPILKRSVRVAPHRFFKKEFKSHSYNILSVRFAHDLERKTGSGKANRVVEYFLEGEREGSLKI